MAFVKIRGSQVQDLTLKNIHIATDAAIAETKLDINWENHYHSALATKKVVDFVQVNGVAVTSGSSLLDVTALLGGKNAVTSLDSNEGVIVTGPKNRVPLRDAVTGDPFTDASGYEVYGRVEHTPAAGENPEIFTIKFYTTDGVDETPFTFVDDVTIDYQYAQRFNLDTVDEMFAANEKFVEGAADATAHLNIQQLAKDLYGSGFSLDRDGNANLSKSLSEQLADEISRATAAEQAIQNALTQEIADREAGDTAIRNDLASNLNGKGASLIGIEDVAGNYESTNLEDALVEIDQRLDALAGGGSATGQEVEEARKSTALTGVEVTHATLDARLEAGEAVTKAVKDEVEGSRGIFLNLNARLDDMDAKNAGQDSTISANKQAVDDYITANDTRVAAIEGKNSEQDNRIDALESKNTEQDGKIAALEAQDIADANRMAALEAKDLEHDGKISSLESKDVEQDSRLDALEAGGTGASGRISDIETYINQESNKLHVHKKHVYVATGGETEIAMPADEFFQLGDDSLDFYLNGMLQAKTLNYTEVADANDASKGVKISLGTEQLAAGDIVVLKYVTNNPAKTF